jgi:hypothetical protein
MIGFVEQSVEIIKTKKKFPSLTRRGIKEEV